MLKISKVMFASLESWGEVANGMDSFPVKLASTRKLPASTCREKILKSQLVKSPAQKG